VNSKERVKAALEFREPDMVPYGEFAIDFDTVERLLGRKTYLRNKAGIQLALWQGRRREVAESLIRDSIEVAEKVELDILSPPLLPPEDPGEVPRKVDENTWEFDDGRVLKYSAVTNDFTVVHWPPGDYLPTDEELERKAAGERFEEGRLEALRLFVEKFGDTHHITWGGTDEAAMPLFGGMTNGLSYYVTDPGRIKAYCEAACEGAEKTDPLWAEMGADSVMWGMDFSFNSGPFLSPGMFRDLVLPYAKRRVDSVHASGMKVLKHCCGNNKPLLDAFVEIGYDCYQSIQTSAGLDIAQLKDYLGDSLALWGGVAVENLVSGTPEDVSRDVEYALTHGKPGGGYIFGTSHSVAVGTKYENWLRMMEDFRALRSY